MEKLPVYEMLIDENMDSDLMVDFIALVDRPAIKKDFVKFNDQEIESNQFVQTFAIQDEEKRIISGPLMIANQKIFRTDPELGDYEVFFSPETIKKIAIKMAKKGFHNNVNLMHNADMKVPGVTLFEVFQSDKARGIRPMKGFEDLADGTLFGSMYVENPVAWQMIKDGFIKGFSVEGNFGMKKKDQYLEQFEKIVEILNSTTI
jgi:hypothetical protein